MPVRRYAVIGDLVGSRVAPDRRAVQDALGDALAAVNDAVPPAQPLEPTVGDEFQGAFLSLYDAVRASLLVRLTLLPVIDSRCGIGLGDLTVHDESRRPLLQDGPAWWAARAAIEELDRGRAHRRTWFVVDEPGAGAADDASDGPSDGPGARMDDAGSVNAFLTCRDQLLEHLNDRGLRILRLALLGRSQKEIAAEEGVWPSAVSQQFSRGVGAIVDAHQLLAPQPTQPTQPIPTTPTTQPTTQRTTRSNA